jgi:hypothetical protein
MLAFKYFMDDVWHSTTFGHDRLDVAMTPCGQRGLLGSYMQKEDRTL